MRTTLSLFLLVFLLGCNEAEIAEGQLPDNVDNNQPIVKPEPTPAPGTTPPPGNAPRGILKIGILGDLNGSLGDPNYASTVKSGMGHILSSGFDIIIGTGDFTSGEDYKKKFPPSRFREMWNSFESKILNPIKEKGIPFAPSPGNHDASIERERGYYKDFWKDKTLGVTMVSTEAYPFYYSFLYKGVFFISLDNVRTYSLRDRTVNGVTQREWVKNQLNSEEARTAVARIAYGHVPLYPVLSKSKHSKNGRGKYYAFLGNEQQGKRSDSLEQIFKDGDLSLAVFGHSHAYYPGVVHHNNEALEDSLRILSMPCLGHGNRYLDQRTSARSARGYGAVTVDLETGHVTLDAHGSDGTKVDKTKLPERIRPYSHLSIRRHDLVKKELGE
ncbi:MAG: hypothetical protein CME70_15205 [Halobacteriovorax sp.]|nr:hypothetical protein [Halobacteriovorax sp.]|tara:strand:+ start:89664 stop:90821 length:1158 start_codon:yes stop_codon:yes gene_type:complete